MEVLQTMDILVSRLLSKARTRLFCCTFLGQLPAQVALRMVHGSKATRNGRTQRILACTNPLLAMLGMILLQIKPVEVQFKLTLSMDPQFQQLQPERKNGTHTELLSQQNIQKNSSGNKLIPNFPQNWELTQQIKQKERNLHKCVQLGHHCGQ